MFVRRTAVETWLAGDPGSLSARRGGGLAFDERGAPPSPRMVTPCRVFSISLESARLRSRRRARFPRRQKVTKQRQERVRGAIANSSSRCWSRAASLWLRQMPIAVVRRFLLSGHDCENCHVRPRVSMVPTSRSRPQHSSVMANRIDIADTDACRSRAATPTTPAHHAARRSVPRSAIPREG